MQKVLFFIALFSATTLCAQQEQIVSKHKNGNPEFVVWMKGDPGSAKIVREEAYYEDGTIEYTGNYKDGVEDGVWIYYYENGNKRLEETYRDGLEHGVRYEYAPDGSLSAEFHYNKGRLGKEIRHK